MTVERLREFIDGLSEAEEYGIRVRRQEPWWVALNGLAGHDFNRDISPPGAHKDFPEGAVRVMVDDDFWEAALLPYEFCDLSIETLVSILWPEVENPEFRPDSGTPEQREYYAERERKIAAFRLASEEREPTTGARFSPSYSTAQRVEGTIYSIVVRNPATDEREIRRVDVEEYFARHRGKTPKFK